MPNFSSHQNFSRLRATVFLAVFSVNAFFAVQWPYLTGDWDAYGVVAENIHAGHGVSLAKSPPYEPAFGGNSFPGYPAFVATMWKLLGHGLPQVGIAQSFFFALAVVWFMGALKAATNARVAVLFGIFAALSPLTMAWNRSLFPQGPSITVTLFFFSLLLSCLNERKIRILALSVAILTAIYLRTDGVLLFVPLTVLLLKTGPLRQFFKKFLAVALIVGIGVGAWFVRNAVVGLDPITPPSFLVLDDEGKVLPTPNGYILWGWTWMSKEYERGGWGFPVTRAHYDHIYIPPSAYDNDGEQRAVEALLARLENETGKAFPKDIDDAFRHIARERIRRHPVKIIFGLPLKRAFALWFHPGSSVGWPIQMDDLSYAERTALESNYLTGALALIKTRPVPLLAKALVFGATLFFQIAGLCGLIFVLRSRDSRDKTFGFAVLSYMAAMTALLSCGNYVESRYLSQTYPLLYYLAARAFSRDVTPEANSR